MSDKAVEREESAGGKPEPTLDDLFREFEEAGQGSEAVTAGGADRVAGRGSSAADKVASIDKRLDAVTRFIEEERERRDRESYVSDIDKAVGIVKKAVGAAAKLPDRLVRGAIVDLAERDPRFLDAWRQRKARPNAFERLLSGLGRELAAEMKGDVDEAATEDREALKAAAKGQPAGSKGAGKGDDEEEDELVKAIKQRKVTGHMFRMKLRERGIA